MSTTPRPLRAELRKLRFTRSLLALPVAGFGISVLAAFVLVLFMKADQIAARLSEHGPLRFGPTNVGLVLVIFAIRIVADETHHHTLATTFIATPRRLRVLVSKAIIAATTAAALCAAIYAFVVPITTIALEARGLSMANDARPTVDLFGRVTLAMTLLSLLAVAFAAAVRNRAIALVGAAVWIGLAEGAIGRLLRITEYLPAALVRALVTADDDGLAPATAGAALGAYVLAAFALAVPSWRRDVD